jgi:hypothetical protein
MGYCPPWYTIIRAAKYMGVAPWELIDQPKCWAEWALAAESAEVEARNRAERRQAGRAKARRH